VATTGLTVHAGYLSLNTAGIKKVMHLLSIKRQREGGSLRWFCGLGTGLVCWQPVGGLCLSRPYLGFWIQNCCLIYSGRCGLRNWCKHGDPSAHKMIHYVPLLLPISTVAFAAISRPGQISHGPQCPTSHLSQLVRVSKPCFRAHFLDASRETHALKWSSAKTRDRAICRVLLVMEALKTLVL